MRPRIVLPIKRGSGQPTLSVNHKGIFSINIPGLDLLVKDREVKETFAWRFDLFQDEEQESVWYFSWSKEGSLKLIIKESASKNNKGKKYASFNASNIANQIWNAIGHNVPSKTPKFLIGEYKEHNGKHYFPLNPIRSTLHAQAPGMDGKPYEFQGGQTTKKKGPGRPRKNT